MRRPATKGLCLLFLLLGAAAVPGSAEKPAGGAWADVKRWLENLKQGLASSSVQSQQRKVRGVVAVAAVRGNRQSVEDPASPYWKDTAASREARAARREREELGRAVDLALAGKGAEALQALDAFEAAHPQSALLAECRQARERLAALPAPEPAPVVEPGAAASPPAPAPPEPSVPAAGGQTPEEAAPQKEPGAAASP
ncbi:MAG: hypothetical protein HY554_16430 [Elusimicrobia bacterium]|nr:hypothetical protein [Elusimicrobiota bacterium]